MIKKKSFTEKELKLIGNRLKKFRGNTSVRKFAKDMQITYSRLGYIESGLTEPTLYEIRQYQKKFNVSYDYLLGLTDEITTNIDIKAINKKYGLTENSLKNLQIFKNLNKDISKNLNIEDIVDTINIILSEEITSKNKMTLLRLIDMYMNTTIDKNYTLAFQGDGKVQLYDEEDSKTKRNKIGLYFIRGDLLVKGILVEIENKLIEMKEGKKNECKGTGKK